MAMYEERCLHSDVCKYGKNRSSGMYCTGERCLHFKNREKWAEKKNGKWDKNHPNDNIVYCDQCYMPQDMPTPFCHSCGAEMSQE